AATNCSIATTNAASDDFMSAAPRPYRYPSRTVGSNGSDSQASSGPDGTTSVCPAKHTTGGVSPPRGQRLLTPLATRLSQRKPLAATRSPRRSWQPASSGVCERRAISWRARSSVGALDELVATLRVDGHYGRLRNSGSISSLTKSRDKAPSPGSSSIPASTRVVGEFWLTSHARFVGESAALSASSYVMTSSR